MMKLKNIFAIAILAVGGISLPSMAITQNVSTSGIGGANYSWGGCTWSKFYENGAFGTASYYYKPVGACSYTSLSISWNTSNNYATLTAN